MPEMPAFLADVLVPRFARQAAVAEVRELAPRLRQVRFAGEALRGVTFRPGQEVEFRVSERAFRHYTPSRFDAARGSLEVVFFLHGDGPGAAWAEQLRPQQLVSILGPGGRFGLQPGSAKHVLLGDESTLGLFSCLAAAAPGRCLGAIEFADADGQARLSALELPLAAVPREGVRGETLLRWLEAAALAPSEQVCFYLAGHAGSIVRIRERLLRRGWSRRHVRTKPYWADGKRGL